MVDIMWPSMLTSKAMLGWQFGTATKKLVTAMLLPSSGWRCTRWNSAGLLVGWWHGCARAATISTPSGCWPIWCKTWLSATSFYFLKVKFKTKNYFWEWNSKWKIIFKNEIQNEKSFLKMKFEMKNHFWEWNLKF